MFSWLIKWFVGSGVSTILSPIKEITEKIVGLEEARVAAETDEDRLRYDREIRGLEAQRDVLIAESRAKDRTSSRQRSLIAAGPTFFLLKVFVVDLALGSMMPVWIKTDLDAVPAPLWTVLSIVVGFYMVTDAGPQIINALTREKEMPRTNTER